MQTGLLEHDNEFQGDNEFPSEQTMLQGEQSQHTGDHLHVELADRKQRQEEAETKLQEAESKLQEAESHLQDLQSCLERAETALREREEAIEGLRSRLESTVGRLRSMEEAEELKERRLKKHLLLLQESQERERHSLGASLELAEQRAQDLEERLQRQEAQWAAEAQRRSTEMEARRSEMETRCAELVAQLEESDGEIGRLRERLRAEETLYYDLEHNYERVREELECAKGREQSCEQRCCHLLERKERELQEMLVKMAALGNSLEETEQRLQEAREESTCRHCASSSQPVSDLQEQLPWKPNVSTTSQPQTLLIMSQGADVRPKVRRGSIASPSEGAPSTTAAAGEESDKVISVIQALESKLSDTEERLREITLHLQQQHQQQDASHQRSASGTSTWNPSCRAEGRGPNGYGVTGQRGVQETVPDEMLSALAMVFSVMANALEQPKGKLQGRLSELHQEAHKQRSVHDNVRAAHLLFLVSDLGFSNNCVAAENTGELESREIKEISDACVRAELAYLTHALLTDTLHEPGRDFPNDENCSWGATGGGLKSGDGQELADLSPPELTLDQGLEDELHKGDTSEPQCRDTEEGLVSELCAQAQELHRLSLQLLSEKSKVKASCLGASTTTDPAVLSEALLHAQSIYVARRARAAVLREAGSLRSQYERAVSECQTVCSSMETLFQEQAERYEARLREESHALDCALSHLEKEQEERAVAEASAQQRDEEVRKLEAEFREKLQELQEIHEEEMGRLHGYYAQVTTSVRTAQENSRERAGLVSVANLKERIRELEEEVGRLKDELGNREERRDSKAQDTNHQRDLESLKVYTHTNTLTQHRHTQSSKVGYKSWQDLNGAVKDILTSSGSQRQSISSESHRNEYTDVGDPIIRAIIYKQNYLRHCPGAGILAFMSM